MKPSFLNAALGAAIALIAIPAIAGEIILFEHTDFAGRRMVIHDTMPNLDRSDFNDRAQSIIVRDGVWELCSDARFEGNCTRVQPGEYRALGGELNKRISSVREVGQPYAQAAPYPPSYGGPAHGYDGQVGAVLYEGPGFHGRSFDINRPVVRDLDRTSCNDRAQSVRLYSGYWMFCSDSNFEGECRTFGPGEYPDLPGGLNRRISSGRKISDRYPYAGHPNWGG